ncbi:reverse transcriptase domain-containing protein [Tanacetum coccineum]
MQNYHNNSTASTSRPGTLPSQTVTNPREQINAITTRSGKTLEGPSTPLVPTPVVSKPQKEPEQNPETSTEKVQNPNLENTAHVPPPEEEESIFMEIPKPKAKKTVNVEIQDLNSPRPNSALADFGASINLLPHSIYKKLRLEALTPTRMTLELANRSITHPMGIAEDVVVRVDGFTFLADFVVVNFEPDAEIGKEELVYYADKSEKNKNKHCVHAISVIDFSKDDPFSGSTTTHSDDPSPSSSPVKTSDNFEIRFADELAFLIRYHRVMIIRLLRSTINPLFDEMEENVEIKNSNVSDEPVLLNTPLSDKVECFAPEDNNDEIDDFLAMEVSSNFEEGYFDSEGDVTFLDNLLSDDASHNLASEVISDHEPEQNESSITFSPRSDPLHHEFAGEPLTLPARNDREFEEYLSLMTVLCEISTSQSQGNVHEL